MQPNHTCTEPCTTTTNLDSDLADWQIAMRNNAPVTSQSDTAPIYAPTWAGGRGQIPEPGKPWAWEDMEAAEAGITTGKLEPFEIAILQGRTGQDVSEFLEELDAVNPEPSPEWIPEWARCFTNPHMTLGMTPNERKALGIYWELDLFGTIDVAQMIGRTHEETLSLAKKLGLPEKPTHSEKTWCGVKWEFQLNAPSDPKLLDSSTQYMVAQASATRFSLLYERINQIDESDSSYRSITQELDRILRLHARIFEKFVSVKSRKYNQCSPSPVSAQEDLEQAGKTAIFECLRRWHPDRNIRFSRGAVCIAITREMIAWLETQRLVGLPDKIRSLARKLKSATDSGQMENEYARLVEEAGEKSVNEASKHQNNYAYITTIPLTGTYMEDDNESATPCAASAQCMEGFETSESPNTNVDLTDVILRATEKLSAPEKRAVLLYHGITAEGEHTNALTLEEIGKIENVTKERIRQRISKAKERMRRWLESHQVRSLNDALNA